MKFLVDMPLSPAVAGWLQQTGHDAIHASTLDLARASDEALLMRARADDRIVVTADLDYPRLLWLTRAVAPGLILFRSGVYAEREVIDRLSRVLDTVPAMALTRSIVVVERERIRRRSLPLP